MTARVFIAGAPYTQVQGLSDVRAISSMGPMQDASYMGEAPQNIVRLVLFGSHWLADKHLGPRAQARACHKIKVC